jgi:aromatic ring-cleaving dioxygenase
LVHPHTENAYNDHLVFGFWLGDKLPLNEECLIRMADRESR